jgi:hypothetical protein
VSKSQAAHDPEKVHPATGRALRQRHRETPEYLGAARRFIRGAGVRIASGEVESLPGLLALQADLDTALADAVAGLRAQGYSWAEIAAHTGTTRQAAQMRWGRRGDR